MSKKQRSITLVAICIISLFVLAACSSKKGDALQIFSDEYAEEYQSAAREHFSKVNWTRADYFGNPEEHNVSLENGTLSLEIGTISDDTRYVVVISGEEEILDRDPLEGKRYTVYVYDNGTDDIRISMRYSVGTTDNCVVKGNVVDGEVTVNRTIELSGSGTADTSDRAALIFNALYTALVDIEGN